MTLTNMTQVSEGDYWHTNFPLRSDVTFQSGMFEEDQTVPYREDQTKQSVSIPLQIDTLTDSPYSLRQPIPVRLEKQEDGEWIASFEEANISMSGSDSEEAIELLAENIESAFALFLAEEKKLSPRLAQNFAVLRQYIIKKDEAA